MTLYKQHARNEWTSLLVWSLMLAGLICLAVTMWEGLRESGALNDMETMLQHMPGVMTALYGNGDITTLRGWLSAYAFGTWLALPLVVYVSLFVTGIVTREIDRRTMEFLLAQPVARHQIIIARWVNLVLFVLVLHLALVLGAAGGVALIGGEVELGRYLLAALNLALVFIALGSVQLALSIFVDDYGKGLGVTLGFGFGLFMLYSVTGQATGFLASLRGALPFALYDAAPMLEAGTVPWGHLGILAGVALAGLGLSVWLFERKQISV